MTDRLRRRSGKQTQEEELQEQADSEVRVASRLRSRRGKQTHEEELQLDSGVGVASRFRRRSGNQTKVRSRSGK